MKGGEVRGLRVGGVQGTGVRLRLRPAGLLVGRLGVVGLGFTLRAETPLRVALCLVVLLRLQLHLTLLPVALLVIPPVVHFDHLPRVLLERRMKELVLSPHLRPRSLLLGPRRRGRGLALRREEGQGTADEGKADTKRREPAVLSGGVPHSLDVLGIRGARVSSRGGGGQHRVLSFAALQRWRISRNGCVACVVCLKCRVIFASMAETSAPALDTGESTAQGADVGADASKSAPADADPQAAPGTSPAVDAPPAPDTTASMPAANDGAPDADAAGEEDGDEAAANTEPAPYDGYDAGIARGVGGKTTSDRTRSGGFWRPTVQGLKNRAEAGAAAGGARPDQVSTTLLTSLP